MDFPHNMNTPADRTGIADSLSLMAVVLVSTLPYVFGLGLYCDDWIYEGILQHASAQGVGAMFREMAQADPHFLIRPAQLIYFVLGFKAFGRHAMPYHLLSSVILGLAAVLLYLVLKELRIGRWMAFAIAMVFGLLPQYSTDRIWISSHQALTCMAFALLGIYGLLRSVRPGEQRPAKWIVLAAAAMILSILSYEIAFGLILAALGTIGWRKYSEVRHSSKRGLAGLAGIAGTAAALLLVFLIKSRMQSTMVYHHHLFQRFGELTWHTIVQAVRFNLWTYCLHLPAVLISLYRNSALSMAAIGAATFITAFVALYLWRFMEPSAIPNRRACLCLIAAGFVLFGIGYALFFPSPTVDFSSPGLSNRVAIVSALGAACVLVALAALASSLLNNSVVRARAFSIVLGILCGMNSLAVSGIGYYWANAASQQASILKSVAGNVKALPQGSVLILDGFCRYSGPAVVFESDYDTSAAVQFTLNDDSLRADVVSPNLHFHDTAADSMLYGQPEDHYSYGDHLFVYDVPRRSLTPLSSGATVNDYLHAMDPTGDSSCPAGQEGDGMRVF